MEAVDYVIVGAGSAGCVLASRLSQDAACEVALLEAGGEDRVSAIHQPSLWPLLWDTADAWGYATSKQPGYAFRTIACPRGKVLGGSSSLNAMVYMRGVAQDFDHWRELGNEGWGWSDVLPYFIRSEDQSRGASALHGTAGPLTVSDPESPNKYSLAFVEAAVACGHRRNPDFNGEYLDGVGLYQRTIRDGRRCSTAVAFLRPAYEHANLTVLTGARTLRVLLQGDKAIGVEYFREGQVQRLMARQEVIVSAGAIDSPKLLMLSGIGDAAQLRAHGIAVRIALAGVGAHLCDHPTASLFLQMRQPDLPPPQTNYAEAGLFMRSTRCDKEFDADIQFHIIPFGLPWAAVAGRIRGLVMTALVCRPESRGRLTLRSADAMDPPIIDPGYMTHPADMAVQIEALRAARQIAATMPLKADILQERSPGPACIDDASLERHVRMTGDCLWHPVGTCRMGPGADAVVDAQLRVHGVRALRVVDASVMPQTTSANTNAPTIMIAEKASDMILSAL